MCGSVISQVERTARKRHWCGMCHGPILPGERYDHQVTADGGSLSTYDSHTECLADATRLIDTGWDGCFTGTLYEYVAESGEPIDNHDLTPIVAERLRQTKARADAASQRWITDVYASNYPQGRWADDGGPADARA